MTASSPPADLAPAPEDRDRLLRPLLVVMTVVTGIVDAVSYLALGHVFVANMTGNVVFLGFALAEAGGLSVPASLGGAGGVPVRCGCRRTARRPPGRAPAGGQLHHP